MIFLLFFQFFLQPDFCEKYLIAEGCEICGGLSGQHALDCPNHPDKNLSE